MKNKIVIELSIEELNQILGALAKLPYEVSVSIINKLVKIAQEQLKNNE